ncbi:MAG: putative acetyltransferase [Chloroflexi bacterium OLB15]|nr:MAG: putative acetyltransferase [Chloroflexi bacterium OLB15]
MTDYTIRLARADETGVVVHHRSAMFLDMGVDPTLVKESEPLVYEWVKSRTASGIYTGFFAVTTDDTPIAGAGLSLLDWIPGPGVPQVTRGYVLNVYTEPEHRHRGLASLLVQRCVTHCRENGISTVSLHASDMGRSVYEKLGFSPTNEMRIRLRL